MFSRFADFDRTFDVLEEFRKQMDRVWGDFEDQTGGTFSTGGAPRVNIYDGGANLVVEADVPGLREKDLDVSLKDGVLSIAGERKAETLEGFTAHRRERGAYRFSRSLKLPVKLDAEKATAVVKDGVLTVTIAKAQDVLPRQIPVRAPA